MTRRDPDDDHDDDHDEGFITWKMIPPLVTVAIAIGAIIAGFYTSMSDLKVRDMEIGSKVQYLEQRVEKIEDVLNQRGRNIERDKEGIWNEIDTLKELLKRIDEQHKNGRK